MNIKSFFRKQKEGLLDVINGATTDELTTTLFMVSWVVLLVIFITLDGFIIGFVKTVCTSAVVCTLSYNIYTIFFKK